MTVALQPNQIQQSLERPIDITRGEFRANPHPFYARVRAEQPVYRAKLGKQDVWLVTRYDDVVALLKDERFVKNRSNVGDGGKVPWVPGFLKPLATNMLDQDDPNHARLRALVHKAFTPSRVEQMSGHIQQISNELIDRVQGRGSMDLVAEFALQVPLTVISEMMGVAKEDRMRFHRWVKAGLTSPSTLNTLLALPSLYLLMRFLRRLIAERRAKPSDDLLTALVQAEEAGDRVNQDELVGMAVILLIAGYETTVNLIASGTLALLQHPDQLEKLRQEPTLARTAMEELVRFAAPVAEATERYAREEVTIAGVTIPRGSLTLAVLASANRDESVFERPDELDITREKNRHVGFGQGAHYCVGAPLARMEGAIAIDTLLERLPNLRLAIPADQLRWRSTPMVRGLEALPVRF